ncbi:GNAT family N-acetyltransferase [Streptomyces sp. NPDC014894]|uniref:GNAT family N-acetyltransferase n=1 Tax=Streptomyces sp. NPDC014894 TaxID=3364931 RepID=UPI0036FE6075
MTDASAQGFRTDDEASADCARLLTPRLSLRRPVPADVDAVLAIHRDPRTCLHNPSDALTRRAEAEALCRSWHDQWERHGYGCWVVRRQEGPERIGLCGITTTRLNGIGVLNLFYRFAPAFWGRGFAAEAATAVVGWAARRGPGLPLVARIRPENTASRRVAVRAGLTRARHLDGPGVDGFEQVFAVEPHPYPPPH